ncbi:hypothetical protein MRBLMN1_004343 [Chitinophaga ginsengisegetis]|uniref:hypothetical protein n=1 Tax=Chitinophaga ginsengisegetis TaxID=393003 RepID=UPI0034257647
MQDYLEGRKTSYSTQLGNKEIFQLRGTLLCPRCGKLLTSSASRGCSGKKYAYYHCHSSCGFRVGADI